MRLTKEHKAQVKALGEGTVEAYVAMFNNVDLVGDRILPGAFTKSIEDWRASGDPIPFVFSHLHDNLDAYIGKVVSAEEDEKGLKVTAELDLEEPAARKAYKLMKDRVITKFSFAYDVVRERRAKDGANELLELKVLEVGPTLIPANPATELVGVKKETEVKRGRVLSAKNESDIRKAIDLLNSVLSQVEGDEEKSEEKSDEPERVKDDEPPTKNLRRLLVDTMLLDI